MTDRRRCAIYTRKSTEEGLEQDFNSLHAQREACEAFVRSQRHEGWQVLPEAFDDGGYSGGTMNRPALARLLEAAKTGKVDVIVVYKVDRLTRSLVDFARMVELFDANGVSFVSVTQQFNTTTSMGRLTLNVLLSFAQFEREVTGERIRDKIAASKRKGMWMGGLAPLGYDIKDRALVVNESEAETVRTLFRLYRELGTVRQLAAAAPRLGLMTKQRRRASGQVTGGQPFTRGHLYQLLSNPIYVGEVAHKGLRHAGRHEAILDRETFEAIQRQLKDKAAARRSATNDKTPSLLAGLIFDEIGDRLTPTHANKKGRRYRYYVSRRLIHPTGATADGWRVPAKELEAAVVQATCRCLRDDLWLIKALQLDQSSPERLLQALTQAAAMADKLEAKFDEHRRELLTEIIHRISLGSDSIRLEIRRAALAALLAGTGASESPEGLISFDLPIELKRRGVEAKLVLAPAPGQPSTPDARLLTLLADAQRWFDDLTSGRAASVRDLAKRYGRDKGEVSRTLALAFLAPDIVAAILDGRQPVALTPHRLKRLVLPLRWREQRSALVPASTTVDADRAHERVPRGPPLNQRSGGLWRKFQKF